MNMNFGIHIQIGMYIHEVKPYLTSKRILGGLVPNPRPKY